MKKNINKVSYCLSVFLSFFLSFFLVVRNLKKSIPFWGNRLKIFYHQDLLKQAITLKITYKEIRISIPKYLVLCKQLRWRYAEKELQKNSTLGPFNQHFTRSFCANILLTKKSNLSLSTEKQLKILLYKKAARKMLMKLTPSHLIFNFFPKNPIFFGNLVWKKILVKFLAFIPITPPPAPPPPLLCRKTQMKNFSLH